MVRAIKIGLLFAGLTGAFLLQPSLHETRQNARRQNDARRKGQDAGRAEIVKGEFDSLELGTLKGNQGDQNYDLPASVDLNKYQAVAIYCERFHAIFGVAKLEKF
jgi:hypothetical protein